MSRSTVTVRRTGRSGPPLAHGRSARQRRLPAALAVTLLLGGLVATPAGAAVGVVHAVKVGLTPTSLLGLALLGLGLAALVVGGGALVRRLPGWWRLLAVPAACALLVLVMAPVGLAVAANTVPPTTVGADTPADRGLAFEDVTFTTADGVTLSGWYVPGRDGSAVVLLHGAGQTRTSVLEHLAVLARRGHAVLAFDARGHGRSGGRAMDFGWFGNRDVAAAVDFLAARPEVDRIAAVGLSMGGEQALGAAAADPRLRAVVAEGATGRSSADHGWYPEHPLRWVNTAEGWVQDRLTSLLAGVGPPTPLHEAVAAIAPRRVLLVTAGRVADEGRAAAYLEAAGDGNVAVWEVEAAGHTGGLAAAPATWERRVGGFLDAALGS